MPNLINSWNLIYNYAKQKKQNIISKIKAGDRFFTPYKKIAKQEIILTKRGQQATAFNFIMTEHGNVFDINYEKIF